MEPFPASTDSNFIFLTLRMGSLGDPDHYLFDYADTGSSLKKPLVKPEF
ncbi:hypothetical protein AVEN_142784-1, partial [Araneus ventricosus]